MELKHESWCSSRVSCAYTKYAHKKGDNESHTKFIGAHLFHERVLFDISNLKLHHHCCCCFCTVTANYLKQKKELKSH